VELIQQRRDNGTGRDFKIRIPAKGGKVDIVQQLASQCSGGTRRIAAGGNAVLAMKKGRRVEKGN